jgi:hypothetical protein
MYQRKPLMQPESRLFLCALFVWAVFAAQVSAEPAKASGIRIKYIYKDAVYLEAGGSSGLAEGQRLLIKRESAAADGLDPVVIAEIEIESVAATSAAGRIVSSKAEILPGDNAFFSQESELKLRSEASAREVQKYAQVIRFTEGAPPEQEMREAIPKPPLPEINRIQGRIGVDYSALQIPGLGNTSSQFGFMLRLDAQRLAGTHWNIS